MLEVPELHCDHEEADTRLLLHAKHASATHQHIVIRSPDTDVLILSVAFAHNIPSTLYFLTGSGTSTRIVNVTTISQSYGYKKCEAILGVHVFTGCDTVSAFRGKGKVKALKLMLDSPEACDDFQKLGTDWILSDEILSRLEPFVSLLYGQKNCSDINYARYNVFRLKCSTDAALPPNKDCLQFHAMRATYQAAIYRRALQNIISAPSPVGYGWILDDEDALTFEWMSLAPAPINVLKHVHCKCRKRGCQTQVCSCRKAALICTDLCSCDDCQNSTCTTPELGGDGDSDSDEDLDC